MSYEREQLEKVRDIQLALAAAIRADVAAGRRPNDDLLRAADGAYDAYISSWQAGDLYHAISQAKALPWHRS